ncbi:hypothetical protein ACYCFK_17875 [Stutzerimonas stutzeri]
MNQTYLIYGAHDGRIFRCVSCPPDQIGAQLAPGEAYIQGDAPDHLFYIDLVTKTVCRKRDFSLDDLPLPCVVTIEGHSYQCSTQPEFEFDIPGIYEVRVDAGPQYLARVFDYAYPASSH